MHAAFALQAAVGPSAVNREGHALETRLLALGLVEDFGLVAGAIGPAQVHAQQHLGPILRFGTARSGMDRYDRRPLVVRLGQEEARLHPLPVGREGVQVALQVGGQPVAGLVIGLGQLGDLGQAVGARLHVPPGGDLFTRRRHVEAVPARRSGRSTDRDRRCACSARRFLDSLAGKSKAHRRVGHEARQAQGLVLNSVQPRSPWELGRKSASWRPPLDRTLAGLTQGSRSAAGRRRSRCHRSPGCRHSCSACSHARTE